MEQDFTSADELEAYMNRVEDRFMSIYAPHPATIRCWQDYRKHVAQVREGDISGVAMDTATPKAAEYLRGIRRLLGEGLQPRSKISGRSKNLDARKRTPNSRTASTEQAPIRIVTLAPVVSKKPDI